MALSRALAEAARSRTVDVKTTTSKFSDNALRIDTHLQIIVTTVKKLNSQERSAKFQGNRHLTTRTLATFQTDAKN